MEKLDDRGITRSFLRSMGMNTKAEIPGKSYRAYLSSRSTASETGKLEGCRFSCSYDFGSNVLTIKRGERE